jgi:predicted phosphodiesterase
MRALIIADVHGNLDALEALPPADIVICAGDIVTYGPEPGGCIDWLRAHRALCVRGGEDDAVVRNAAHGAPKHLAAAAVAMREWTGEVLTSEQHEWLKNLPPELEVTLDEGRRLAVVHAYPGSYDRYLSPAGEELERLAAAFSRDGIIIIGHTHRSGTWMCGKQLIVNPGSVGQPQHPGKAAYALYENGRIRLATASFSVATVIDKVYTLPIDPSAKAVCALELRRGATRPRSRVGSAAIDAMQAMS